MPFSANLNFMQPDQILKLLEEYYIPDKGLVYFKGCEQPETEATVWACVAASSDLEKYPFLLKSLKWLETMQNADGSVKVNPVCAGQAIWCAAQFAILMDIVGKKEKCKAARNFIISQRSEVFDENPYAEQDNSIVGWSWTHGSFSWVEPTAWALICLRNSEFRDTERYKDGVRLLKNRMIPDKGWNYGNKNVYSTDLIPFIDTTSLALLALHNEIEVENVRNILENLAENSLKTESLYALALAIISLEKFGTANEMQKIKLSEELDKVDLNYMNSLHLSFACLALEGRNLF